jgi:hypothetical protein
VKYAFIQAHSKQYKVSRLCEVLAVSSSGYYDWRDRPESTRAKRNRQLVTKIQVFHKAGINGVSVIDSWEVQGTQYIIALQ